MPFKEPFILGPFSVDAEGRYLLIPGTGACLSYRIVVRSTKHEIFLDTITDDSILTAGCPFFPSSAI